MEDLRFRLLEFFGNLVFDAEKHTYKLKEESKFLPSVSKKIKQYCIPFDTEGIAKRKAEREGLNAEDLKKEWKQKADEACDHGHEVHNFGELYPFNRSLIPSNKKEEAIAKFWNDLPDHIVPVVMELRMFHKKLKYAGTADIILYNLKTQKFIIGDYKTNKDLFKNFAGQKLKGPFRNLLDTPYNKYQIQLSFYKMLLEQFGIEVESTRLLWLLPDGKYDMYITNDLEDALKSSYKF